MKDFVQVGNLKIGEGIPKVCISLMGANKEELIEEVKKLKQVSVDIIEWRIDFFQDIHNIDRVKEALADVKNLLEDIPLIFTFRSKKEGGEKELDILEYLHLYKEIILTGNVDIIDLELFIGDNFIKEMVEYAHSNGVKVIISNHDFQETPSREEIRQRLIKMIELRADLPKIALMPKNLEDSLLVLSITTEITNKYNRPIITMSMGKEGQITRIVGEFFGSALTFASVEKPSAPGQIQIEKLQKVLRLLHEIKIN